MKSKLLIIIAVMVLLVPFVIPLVEASEGLPCRDIGNTTGGTVSATFLINHKGRYKLPDDAEGSGKIIAHQSSTAINNFTPSGASIVQLFTFGEAGSKGVGGNRTNVWLGLDDLNLIRHFLTDGTNLGEDIAIGAFCSNCRPELALTLNSSHLWMVGRVSNQGQIYRYDVKEASLTTLWDSGMGGEQDMSICVDAERVYVSNRSHIGQFEFDGTEICQYKHDIFVGTAGNQITRAMLSCNSTNIQISGVTNVGLTHFLDLNESVPEDTTPPSMTVTSPVNNTAINTIPLNFSITVIDDLSSEILCILSNTSEVFDTETTAGGDINLTFGEGITDIQQRALFNMTCYDNDAANNNSRFILFNLTLDNVFPAIAINLPVNNSIIDKTFSNLTIKSSCSDIHAIAFNYSMINSAETIVNSSQNTTAASNIILNRTVDLKDIEIGNYTINFTCVDGHTYTDSKIDWFIKDDVFDKIYYGTSSGNDISISLDYSDMNLCNYGSRSGFDREIFWYDFKSCNPDSKSLNTYRYILRDNDNQLRYLKDSNYRAHFVTQDNFITFHLDAAADYTVIKSGKDYIVTVKTEETFLDFSNSIGGLNKFQESVNVTIIQSNFTAIEHFDIEINDIILDSDAFITVSDVSFNLSQDRRITMLNSLLLTKFSLPQSSDVTGRITFNNEVLLERSVSSVAGLDTVRSLNFILNGVTGKAGQNNLTYEIKEDGAGSINISNWQTHILTNVSSQGTEIGITSRIIETAFSSLAFTNISSIPVNKAVNSRTFIDIANRLEADVASTVTCLVDSNVTSPIYRRRILSETDVASTGTSFIDDQETSSKTFHLNCSNTEGAVILSNATFIAFNLRALNNDIINANSSSNQNTGLAGSTVSFSAGNNELVSIKGFPIRNGTELKVISTVHLNSTTGEQIVAITLNSSNGCSDAHLRSLIAGDIGTIKFYSTCSASGLDEMDITLGVTVSTGEGVEIVDESLSVIEVITLDKSVANTPPLVNIISPLQDAIIFGESRIEWMTSEPNNNDFSTNISIRNSSNLNFIASKLSSGISNITFNFTILGEGDFTLNISSSENDTPENFTGSSTVSFTVRFPTISVNLTSPLNSSTDDDGVVAFQFATDTGNSNNCSLFIDNTINFINQSINASVGLNSFGAVRLNNGTHTWLVRCDNSSLTGVSEQFILNILIAPSTALSLTTCPTTIAAAFILVLLILISIIFITLGLIFQIGVIGLFGSIMLMVSTWFIAPCSNIFAYILALLSVVLMFFFIFRGFFPKFAGLNG